MSHSILHSPIPPSQPLRSKSSLPGLRKDKPKPPPPDPPALSYFERYPKRAERVKSHEKLRSDPPKSPPPSTPLPQPPPPKETYVFPTVSSSTDEEVCPLTPRRPRPTASRSRNTSTQKAVRSSTSTVDTNTLTPPRTPTASFGFGNDSVSVFVAAPISGVETMDALVDGMNGEFGGPRDSDMIDFLRRGSLGRRSSTREKRSYHPLYHPPLPEPPLGVKLGGGIQRSSSSGSDDDKSPRKRKSSRSKTPRPPTSRSLPEQTVNTSRTPTPPVPPIPTNPSIEDIVDNMVTRGELPASVQKRPPPLPRTVAPSISEIIRTHAPQHARTRTQPAPVIEEHEETSRSSVDSITEEVQNVVRRAPTPQHRSLHHARSFPNRPTAAPSRARSVPEQTGAPPSSYSSYPRSPRSDGGHGNYTSNRPQSVYSYTASTPTPTNAYFPPMHLSPNTPDSAEQAIAQYLRSPRLTRLIKLTRHPHAGLTVSLADVGSPTGRPLLVFLGLGCVRYLIGLYDEMAEALGLRLICIDRWGLGRTNEVSQEKRGMREWAGVCEEVLDTLGIREVQVMAHSAGAPYALAFALRVGARCAGSVHLLAPWVGGGVDGVGYKWLKYVPNTLIKTAQAAEWKVQGWKLGKPPTITYEGIEYNVNAPVSYQAPASNSNGLTVDNSMRRRSGSSADRTSICLSEYDDLADFNGRFGSTTTLGDIRAPSVNGHAVSTKTTSTGRTKRKNSKSIFGIWNRDRRNSAGTPTPPGKPQKLKGLKSMSSLKSSQTRTSEPSPVIPPPAVGLGLGLDEEDLISEWGRRMQPSPEPSIVSSTYPRSRRSISFTAAQRSVSSPTPTIPGPPSSPISNAAPDLTTALLRASHKESLKGLTSDLLSILERDSKPWGFSYADVKHSVRVWYGDRDEKIGEAGIRWMERVMRDCELNIVKGQGHGLMANAAVVVEALESVKKEWDEREGD